MELDVEAEALPGIESGDGVDVAYRRRFGGVGLKERSLQDLVDLEVPAVDRQIPRDARRFELTTHLERRVDVDLPELVAHHCEMLSAGLDFEIADTELVRRQAAVDVERVAAVVFEVQRLDGETLERQLDRGAAV